ncbi:glycosyltransferase [Flavobacterium sp. WW92]|uniref:glycosyltransferase family 2 protein n=1 Tax=unclassified Flavobacterium TaxID=196869 RepID=UPI0022241A2F|nr:MULTISPECIES: galactosyltransferase-related protein [unclassified Flavobacterium]WDO14488.1 glycosyltransferase [Flavobacterium sp. WW92]
MITIFYPYRNREIKRIQRSVDSLAQQSKQNFKVVFIDYGSEEKSAEAAETLLKKYDFVSYVYLPVKDQPWNKCKALNYAVKKMDSDYCFVADIDMIFHSQFTAVLEQHLDPNKATYFQVGFLSEQETKKDKTFESYEINFKTNEEATGMTLFPVSYLKEINGFDEFFHFWGAEDTDIHNRLKNAGCQVEYYDQKLLILHQWHPNYRKRETKTLNKELQLSGIVEINHQHLLHNLKTNATKVNPKGWGNVMVDIELNELQSFPLSTLYNEKKLIDYFLYQQLSNAKNQILAIEIKENPVQATAKYKLKKQLGKKVPQFYSLKEINDQILLHIVSFYHTNPYIYQVKENPSSIIFKIKT